VLARAWRWGLQAQGLQARRLQAPPLGVTQLARQRPRQALLLRWLGPELLAQAQQIR